MYSKNKMKDFYDNNLQSKFVEESINYEKLMEKSYKDNLRRMEYVKYIENKSNSILDIGSGYGFFVKLLSENGYKNVEGLEIGKERRKLSTENCKVKINRWDLLNENFSSERYFNLLTLFHVLEHIENPYLFLTNIKKMMVKGSILLIEVPNSNDHMLNISKEYFEFYWQKAHLNYFNKDILDVLFNKLNFEINKVIYVQRYDILNSFNWVIKKKPILNNQLKLPKGYLQKTDKYYNNILCENGVSDTIVYFLKS